MGGFTSAPPLLAARRFKASSFLHESNSIPGRANRWLSWIVQQGFIGFPSAARRLHNRRVCLTGTPVRLQFQQLDSAACRLEMGLDPARPTALVMGGSQGAHGVNELIVRSLPLFAQEAPNWQWIHLAGATDAEELKRRYQSLDLFAVVHSFFPRMELAMGAATACISRAGASSLAEIAAMRLPAVLIPFPAATDNHQFHNARAFGQTGAAWVMEQGSACPEDLLQTFGDLMRQEETRRQMQVALANWHKPEAADQIARVILDSVGQRVSPQTISTSAQKESASGDIGTRCSSSLQWRVLTSSVPGDAGTVFKGGDVV
jgi:UDP-N-acetylglucosamine--N-acetylmuramyl-(pentapeptide) pyrophosphoryl-undecaprenol N-acetylglucosamine transferase